jgi:serine/threonine protein kinase
MGPDETAKLARLLVGHPRYIVEASCGQGTYGLVAKALDRNTNETVALKFIQRGPQARARACGSGAVGATGRAGGRDRASPDSTGVSSQSLPVVQLLTKYARQEILNQMRLGHPHIVGLREVPRAATVLHCRELCTR